MRFAFQTAIRNIRRKPFRAAALALLVLFLSFTVFAGAVCVISLQRGLRSYQDRLGADVIVIPNSAKGHGTVDEILLQGISGNYYMDGKVIDKIRATEGIGAVTTQFFLTSAKASCCSVRVQIIGFDPETDFSVQPWIEESYSDTIADGDLIAGAKISVPEDRTLTFYGNEYHVAAQLAETGTGLDNAVFTNMNTIRKMAESAAKLLETSPFQGVDINTAASAVLIKAADGYAISGITDDINIHITKVQAESAGSMVSQLTDGLGGVSRIIGAFVIVIWILAVIVLIVVFSMLSNERKKEFAVFRIMGASQSLLFRIMSSEAILISAAGAVLGLAIAAAVLGAVSGTIRNLLGLPFLAPGAGTTALLCAGSLVLSAGAGILTALISARRITKNETGLLIREDG